MKVPKPNTDTFSPALVSEITTSAKAFTAASACLRSSPVSAATASTSPVLFTATSWVCSGKMLVIKEVFCAQVKYSLECQGIWWALSGVCG